MCPSGKHVFESERDARRAARDINGRDARHGQTRRKRKPARPYRCEQCGSWHITTTPHAPRAKRRHKEPRQLSDVRDEARELMLKARGYGDRPGRTGNVDRLLFKNFGQRPPMRDVAAYEKNFERIFGAEKPPPDYGQRDGYTVKPYRGSVLPMELDLPADDEGEVDE